MTQAVTGGLLTDVQRGADLTWSARFPVNRRAACLDATCFLAIAAQVDEVDAVFIAGTEIGAYGAVIAGGQTEGQEKDGDGSHYPFLADF